MRSNASNRVSRREFIATGTAVGLAQSVSAQVFPKTQVWVQLTTGGKPYPPSFQAMFLDPMFFGMEIWPIDQPASFAALLPQGQGSPGQPASTPATQSQPTGRSAVGGGTERIEPSDYPWEPSGGRPHPGYDVLVLNDQMNWPDDTRKLAQQAVEAGRGVVVLHHALGDNQDWPWWYQEVTGGLFVLADAAGMKKSSITAVTRLDVRPTGRHPIVKNLEPLSLVNEEAYKGMWLSPKVTPILQSTHADSDETIGWVGVHPKARVVCIQPGTSRECHQNHVYRTLVRNAIMWSAGRLI